MGVNYYYKKAPCQACGHEPRPVHLGKSSHGWCFSLHVMPECHIDDLPDMLEWLRDALGEFRTPAQSYPRIETETGETVSFHEFLEVVTKRQSARRIKDGWDSDWYGDFYGSEECFHKSNHSKRGPNGLLRHEVDGVHCIGSGSGTWDLIAGEFE